jgi:hypothetical protein
MSRYLATYRKKSSFRRPFTCDRTKEYVEVTIIFEGMNDKAALAFADNSIHRKTHGTLYSLERLQLVFGGKYSV